VTYDSDDHFAGEFCSPMANNGVLT